MTYRITWKYYITEQIYTEYGDIEKMGYLVTWLSEHTEDYELISIEKHEE